MSTSIDWGLHGVIGAAPFMADRNPDKALVERVQRGEKEAFDLFSGASAKANDPDIKRVFDHLAAFERGHVNTIEKALASL